MNIEQDFVSLPNARTPSMSEAALRERHNIMLECARLVCAWCGGRAYPLKKQSHQVTGPNSAGNYTHQHPDGPDHPPIPCAASSIHACMAFERRRTP